MALRGMANAQKMVRHLAGGSELHLRRERVGSSSMKHTTSEGFWVAGLFGGIIGGMLGYIEGLMSNPSAPWVTAFGRGFIAFLVFGSLGALVASVFDKARERWRKRR